MVQRSDYDEWVKEWIDSEKKAGRKCFDVKKTGNSYYVYYQTTRYNSEMKKREKVSGYLGKLVEGVGLVEPETVTDEKETVVNARYGLGVDTGGTYTDAVILDLDDYSVIAKRKSPTTHDDLSIGLFKSVDAVFKATDIRPEDISAVGISTTLATNSVLEGQGGEVGLILIGWNPMEKISFGEKKQVIVSGGYDHRGKSLAPLSKAEIEEAIREVSDGVDSIAISGLFANLNPTQEKKIKALAEEMTGLPTVAGHELSAVLGVDLRAETAVLNGRLIPVVSKFFDDVERTFREKGITAPIMAYKGDGSVMSLEDARHYPVETILSGPAASAMGGKVLSGLEDCIVVDIGGTSTDIAIMSDGFPQVQQDGARIGGWRTRVKAVDMYTAALGGDSKITTVGSKFIIGPERVMPLSSLAMKYPEVISSIKHTTIYDYYVAENGFDAKNLKGKEAKVYEVLAGKGPMNKMEIMNASNGLWVIDGELASLTARGALTHSCLTPTDVMVFLGFFENGDPEGAVAGIGALSERYGMTMMQAAKAVFEEIKNKVAEHIMTKIFDDELLGWKDEGSAVLLRRMTSLGEGDIMTLRPRFNKPIVGIGAPARFMMADLGERIGADVVFPEQFDVGNAVGVVTSKVSDSMSATVSPTQDYRFIATIPYVGTSYHSHLGNAIASASRSMESFLESKVRSMGGVNIKTSSKIKTHTAIEGGMGDWEEENFAKSVNFVEVISRAVGDPIEK